MLFASNRIRLLTCLLSSDVAVARLVNEADEVELGSVAHSLGPLLIVLRVEWVEGRV